jgi:tetratricopeptide (TPR) repeat protein
MTKTNPLGKRPQLTVAMVVRDAADVLADAIESVRPIADEIVVADTGSADGTIEIARQCADIVTEIEWQDSFAAARNECAQRVTGDWVLWLEADETLDDTAAQQLRNFIDEAADANKAYLLFIQRPASNAANCCEQIGQLRLVPNRSGLQFTGRIREQILPSIKEAGLGVDALDCVIRRGNSARDAERERADSLRKLNLANLAVTENGDQSLPFIARAEALAELGRSAEAGAVYRRAIEVAERGSSEMLEAYYGLLTAMDADPAAADLQIATCLKALEVYPLDAQLLCGMGSYLLRAQRLDLAARSYEMAATHGKVDPSIWHLADLADVAVVCWSLVLQLLGDAGRAETVLNDALIERPGSVRLRRQLIELCVKAGRERDALAQCKLLPADIAYRSSLPEVIRGAVHAATHKSAAALGPLRAAYRAGCRDPLCLRWLAAAHLAVGNLADVEAIAAEWERHEPANLEIAAFRRAVEQRRAGPSVEKASPAGPRRIDGPSPTPGLPIDPAAATPRWTSPTP